MHRNHLDLMAITLLGALANLGCVPDGGEEGLSIESAEAESDAEVDLDLDAAVAWAEPNAGVADDLDVFAVGSPSGGDDTAALQQAVDLALANPGGGRVLLSAGVYHIEGATPLPGDPYGYEPAIELTGGMGPVEIYGDDVANTTLEVGNWATAILARRLDHSLALRNLRIGLADDALSHAGGVVLSNDASKFVIELASAYPDPTEFLPLDKVYEYQTVTGGYGHPAYGGGFHNRKAYGEQCQPLAAHPRRLRCNKSGAQPYDVAIGDEVVVIFRKNGHDAIRMVNSADLTVHDVAVYSAPGLGLTMTYSGTSSIHDFEVRRRRNQWQSVSAGATHFKSNRGEASFYRPFLDGMGDDGFNFHNMLLNVLHVSGDEVVVNLAYTNGSVPPREVQVGDRLRFGDDSDPFISQKKAFVEEVTVQGNGNTRLRLDKTDHGFVVGGVLSNLDLTPGVLVRDCTVRDNRGRGILIQAANVRVQDCNFVRNSGPGVLITADDNVFENGRVPADVTIKGGSIINSNRGSHSRTAMLEIAGDLDSGPSDSKFSVLDDIDIREIEFVGPPDVPRIFVSTTNQAAVNLFGNTYNGGDCPVKTRLPPAAASCAP